MIAPQAAQEPGGAVAVLGWLILVASPFVIGWALWLQWRERANGRSEPSRTIDQPTEAFHEPPLAGEGTMTPDPAAETGWYYTKQRQELGPVTEDELRRLAEGGEFSEQDFVWHSGWTSWRRAGTLPWLFASRPPGVVPPPVYDQETVPVGKDRTRTVVPPCATHTAVESVHHCTYCKKPICSTCTFAFPGGLFLCPECAVKPPVTLTPKRKRYLIASYVAAGLSTVTLALMFTPATWTLAETEQDAEAMAGGFGMLAWIFVLVGIAFGAMAKGRKASGAVVKGAWIWNLVLLGALVLLSFVGTLTG